MTLWIHTRSYGIWISRHSTQIQFTKYKRSNSSTWNIPYNYYIIINQRIRLNPKINNWFKNVTKFKCNLHSISKHAYPQNRRYQQQWWSSLSVGPMRTQLCSFSIVAHSCWLLFKLYFQNSHTKFKLKLKPKIEKKIQTKLFDVFYRSAHTNPVRITAPNGINCVESLKYVSSTDDYARIFNQFSADTEWFALHLCLYCIG